MTPREQVLAEIANQILKISRPGVTCVGIDGVDGAGKTVFADELSDVLRAMGASVIRATVDSFHNPRSVRYQKGRDSAAGFFEDSFDYGALREMLLEPLSERGDRRFCRAVFDYRKDCEAEMVWETAPERGILVFDGIFLHRPELAHYWHYSVFLDVPFDVSVPRCSSRGGGSPDPAAPSNRRYVEGQILYLNTCHPRQKATVVVNNETLDAPRIVDR